MSRLKLARLIAAVAVLAGVACVAAAPFIGEAASPEELWGVEPLAYAGAVAAVVGLALIVASYALPQYLAPKQGGNRLDSASAERWSRLTQDYFELFHHDLGRPLRRILGKEREVRAALESGGAVQDPRVKDLLDEIERQAPNFRLMMSNIQVLVQLEAPATGKGLQPVEPAQVVRRIVDRYTAVAMEQGKEITWWAEPAEFGLVYSDSSAIEHVVANLVDNAVRHATTHVEVKLTRNPTHFFVRVWDDGPGIPAQYLPHIFDRGWTPEVARREEKRSSGLGLHIARTLAHRFGGELTVESVAAPDAAHHAAFLLCLPLGKGR